MAHACDYYEHPCAMKTLQLYLAQEHPCSYLEQRSAGSIFIDPAEPVTADLYSQLMHKAFAAARHMSIAHTALTATLAYRYVFPCTLLLRQPLSRKSFAAIKT